MPRANARGILRPPARAVPTTPPEPRTPANTTHVAIVASDSGYVSLALSVCRLGRMVIGIGATGSPSAGFTSTVGEFASYAELHAAALTAVVIGAETRDVESRDGAVEPKEDGLSQRLRDRG